MPSENRDAAWTLAGEIASLRCAALSATVNLARPQSGLDALRIENAAVAGHLLALSPGGGKEWPARVGDSYVRGCDLVATYAATSAWPYAPQIYWSAGELGGDSTLATLSLLVSIQTNLLDTHPEVDVASRLSSEEVLRLSPAGADDLHVESLPEGETAIQPGAGASCVLWRLADRPVSYAEIVPASDFRRLTVRTARGGFCEARWQLFVEFLEKGVIRRARVHTAFLPRENDVELAAELCRAAENQPLPLTT